MLKLSRLRQKAVEGGNKVMETIYQVRITYQPGSVNFRSGHLWREGNGYPGDWQIRQHETGGIEITFGGTRSNSKPVVKIIGPAQVDHFILSCLEVKRWPNGS